MDMRTSLYFLFSFLFLMISCGGESEPSGTAEDNVIVDTTAVDSVLEMSPMTFSDFAEMSVKLPNDQITSLDSIIDAYSLSKESFSQDERDSACMLYVAQMWKVSETVWGEYDEHDAFEEKYGAYGFNIGAGEGELWLNVDTEKAAQKFEGDLSKDLREYLRLGEVTGKQYTADAGMIISYADWADILIELEERMMANSESEYFDQFFYTYQSYLVTFMYGLDNTPAVSFEGGKFEDDVYEAYMGLVNDEEHKTGMVIREHMGRMEVANYEWDWNTRWVPEKATIIDWFDINR